MIIATIKIMMTHIRREEMNEKMNDGKMRNNANEKMESSMEKNKEKSDMPNSIQNSTPLIHIRPITEEPSNLKTQSNTQCKKILYVDDEEVLRKLAVRMFSAAGYYVKTATNADEALKILESESFNLVITDFDMGHTNGEELTKAIKSKYQKMPVIIVSGNEDNADRAKDADAFFQKPLKIDDITTAAKELIEKYDNHDS